MKTRNHLPIGWAWPGIAPPERPEIAVLDREEFYRELSEEEARLREIANKQGKLRLDIESDATKENSPPILNPDEEQREEPLKK